MGIPPEFKICTPCTLFFAAWPSLVHFGNEAGGGGFVVFLSEPQTSVV